MIDENNKYSKMQKEYYEEISDGMNTGNHAGHNSNPNYWRILVRNILFAPKQWDNKICMDFGCGCGRNLLNLLHLSKWKQVIGVDISKNNLIHTKENIEKEFNKKIANKFLMIESNGYDIRDLQSNYVDFVMSTIVFEHIPVHEIRFNILSEIYRVMKENGFFRFQMGYDPEPEKLDISDGREFHDYYENYYDATGTNSRCDVVITNPQQVIDDLTKIGFKFIDYTISYKWSSEHQYWIYFQCRK